MNNAHCSSSNINGPIIYIMKKNVFNGLPPPHQKKINKQTHEFSMCNLLYTRSKCYLTSVFYLCLISSRYRPFSSRMDFCYDLVRILLINEVFLCFF